jgi:hypothetical protein
MCFISDNNKCCGENIRKEIEDEGKGAISKIVLRKSSLRR